MESDNACMPPSAMSADHDKIAVQAVEDNQMNVTKSNMKTSTNLVNVIPNDVQEGTSKVQDELNKVQNETDKIEGGSSDDIHLNETVASETGNCLDEIKTKTDVPKTCTEELGRLPEVADHNTEESICREDISISAINSDKPVSDQDLDEPEPISVIKDDKVCDSDANSVDTNVNSNSQFYESSDSKVDYAVKIDDNDTLSDVDDIKTDSASADSEDSALGSLPSDIILNEREEEAQDRGDGSDSGLGSETADDTKMSIFGLELPGASGLNKLDVVKEDGQSKDSSNAGHNIELPEHVEDLDSQSNNAEEVIQVNRPLRSSLKRKIEEVEENTEEPKIKKKKEGIKFDTVTVYYFPRAQGFTCVPSQGGSTLGMERQHSHMQMFTLAEHAIEQRRLHRQILQQLKNERHTLQGTALSSSEDSDTEEEASDISESELDLDSYYFLQPVPTRQRRALLRAAGVRKIEGYEKDECRDIRTSREFCGCACKGSCNPETCSCSFAGIKCQVDRLNFPCGCTRDGCTNPTGRIEFNPIRVRTHFIHTLMRIRMEKKNEENQAAAKRSWVQISSQQTVSPNRPTSTCISNTPYDGNTLANTTSEGLLRDVSLTPRVEVETCVNGGSFSNVHCSMNNAEATPQPNIQDDMNFRYRNETNNHNSMMHVDETGNIRNHTEHYTSSILQGKGPPYTMPNNAGFEAMTHNAQRFPCDLNYYGQHNDNQFKNLQSFSASSFEEFAHAHNSHMTMFSNYNNIYAAEYMHKQNANVQQHSAMQYHQMAQNHYDMYKTAATPALSADKSEPYYAPLMSMPYHPTNKVQSATSDENWFSNNTLMGLENSEQTQDTPEIPTPVPESQPPADPNVEPTENFGELIKKTMVESVSV